MVVSCHEVVYRYYKNQKVRTEVGAIEILQFHSVTLNVLRWGGYI